MLRSGADVVVSRHDTTPLGIVGKIMTSRPGPTHGGRHTQYFRIRCADYKPVVEIEVHDSQILLLEDAIEEGWFFRWEYLHRTGWRHYSLEESHEIQSGYASGNDSIDMKGGKLGRNYAIQYRVYAAGSPGPHMACQLSGTSGNKRAVRRLLFNPTAIEPDSLEGWKLRWARLPPNCVAEFFNMSSIDGGVLSRTQAMKLLDDNIREKEWSAASKKYAHTPELETERARYRGAHIDEFCKEHGNASVWVWEWYHGKTARAWKSYCGAECSLLEKATQNELDYALLNGGKPFKEFPSRPLKILFGKVWTKEGKVFAFHSQKDLVTKNRRGARRKMKAQDARDYIYYRFLYLYPKVGAMDAYKVYTKYITAIGQYIPYTDAIKQAKASLEKLQARSTWVAPPQEDIPDEFICPLKFSLMTEPAYSSKNEIMHRVERDFLVKWVESNRVNPMTREPMVVADIVVDKRLEDKMTEWMWTFNRKARPSSAASVRSTSAPSAPAPAAASASASAGGATPAAAAAAAAASPAFPKPELSTYTGAQLASVKLEVHRVLSVPANSEMSIKQIRMEVSNRLKVDFNTSSFRKWFRKIIREFAAMNR